MEDEEGNVMTEKVYNEYVKIWILNIRFTNPSLKKQGLI
jgi:hypothetical protein